LIYAALVTVLLLLRLVLKLQRRARPNRRASPEAARA
jgi:hypothetical protein